MGEEDASTGERFRIESALARLDTEQGVQLGLPLAEQRLGHDQQHAPHAFGHQLRDDQTGFDGLAEPDLVGEDATSLRNPSQREHHRIDLMWVRIDAPLALAGRVAALLVRPPQADQVFGQQSALDRP